MFKSPVLLQNVLVEEKQKLYLNDFYGYYW